MKPRTNITIILCSLMAVCTFAGCMKPITCSCFPNNPGPFDHYTPNKYTISWTYFNPVSKVQEYFYHHDSTLSAHDGDTIMLVGRIPNVEVPIVGGAGFTLTTLKEHLEEDECVSCYPTIAIKMPEGRLVESWLAEKGRVVFVKGTIRNLGYEHIWHPNGFENSKNVRFVIDAIQLDSVKF